MKRLLLILCVLVGSVTAQAQTTPTVLQNAVTANGNGGILNLNNAGGASGVAFVVTVSGTATVTFEATREVNDTGWTAIFAKPLNSSTEATTTTASGQFTALAPQMTIRARVSGCSGCMVSVKAWPSPGIIARYEGGESGLTVGGAITGGTDTRVLFDDAGTLGEDGGFVYNKTTDRGTIGSLIIGAGSAITSSGAGGALGSNAFTSTAYTPTSRTITTTSPVTIDGGSSADLSANRTLACATCGVTGNRIDQNNAATTSAQLAGVVSDETGSGLLMFATSPRVTTGLLDTNGNSMLAFTPVASAVDYLTITNAAAASPASVLMSATGADTNINIQLTPKGTGQVNVGGATSSFGALGYVAAPRLDVLLGDRSDWGTAGARHWFGIDGSGNKLAQVDGGNGAMRIVSTGVFGVNASTTDSTASLDTGLSRISAGLWGVGTGAAGDFSGSIKATNFISNGVMRLKGYTVATLPAGTQGDTAFCTDLLTPAFFTIIVGGGTVIGPVFFNGTNWIAM